MFVIALSPLAVITVVNQLQEPHGQHKANSMFFSLLADAAEKELIIKKRRKKCNKTRFSSDINWRDLKHIGRLDRFEFWLDIGTMISVRKNLHIGVIIIGLIWR